MEYLFNEKMLLPGILKHQHTAIYLKQKNYYRISFGLLGKYDHSLVSDCKVYKVNST